MLAEALANLRLAHPKPGQGPAKLPGAKKRPKSWPLAGCLKAALKKAFCRSKADPYLAEKGLGWAVPTSWSPEFGWADSCILPGNNTR